jgi:pyridoxal 5'-phosphate synthase pdxT subunit
MSKKLQQGGGVSPLGLMNITTKRNSYGRQNDSFSTNITLEFSERPSFEAIFIRAPSIESIDSNVKVLASYKGSPILVQEELCLAATFHPELTDNQRIHEYFLHVATQNKL